MPISKVHVPKVPPPKEISDALSHCGDAEYEILLTVRQMILEMAPMLEDSGGIVESLKWGQPS